MTNLFHIRANALISRYKRSRINAGKRRLANLAQLSRITGVPQVVPKHLLHLRQGAGL